MCILCISARLGIIHTMHQSHMQGFPWLGNEVSWQRSTFCAVAGIVVIYGYPPAWLVSTTWVLTVHSRNVQAEIYPCFGLQQAIFRGKAVFIMPEELEEGWTVSHLQSGPMSSYYEDITKLGASRSCRNVCGLSILWLAARAVRLVK